MRLMVLDRVLTGVDRDRKLGWEAFLNPDKDALLFGLLKAVFVDREEPAEVFSEVADLLKAPNILFANSESPTRTLRSGR
jgi:hypothetical protein